MPMFHPSDSHPVIQKRFVEIGLYFLRTITVATPFTPFSRSESKSTCSLFTPERLGMKVNLTDTFWPGAISPLMNTKDRELWMCVWRCIRMHLFYIHIYYRMCLWKGLTCCGSQWDALGRTQWTRLSSVGLAVDWWRRGWRSPARVRKPSQAPADRGHGPGSPHTGQT